MEEFVEKVKYLAVSQVFFSMFKRNLTPAVKRPPRITAEGDSDTDPI